MPRWVGFCSVALVVVGACTQEALPPIDPIAPRDAIVGQALTIPITIYNPDRLELQWRFLSTIPGLLDSATIEGDADGATFRWTPLTSHQGHRQITIVADSSAGSSRAIVDVEVAASAATAPLFIKPAAGKTYNWMQGDCVDVDVQVRDNDSQTVVLRLVSGPPSGELTNGDGREFVGLTTTFHWCPTMQQVQQMDTWPVVFSADDGDHPTVMHTHQIVIATQTEEPPPLTDCAEDSGEPDNDAPSARAIAAGPFSGAICGNDDFLRFTSAGADVAISVVMTPNPPASTSTDLDLDLLTSTGEFVATSNGTSNTEMIELGLAPGDYLIRVYGYRDSTGSYSGTLTIAE